MGAETILNPPKQTEAVQSAIEAIQRGDLGQGRATLTWVLRENPNNRLAWLWMACCVEDEPARDECYRRASSVLTPGL